MHWNEHGVQLDPQEIADLHMERATAAITFRWNALPALHSLAYAAVCEEMRKDPAAQLIARLYNSNTLQLSLIGDVRNDGGRLGRLDQMVKTIGAVMRAQTEQDEISGYDAEPEG